MTVSTVINREQYTGNGTTADFPFRFRLLKDSHMVVTVSDRDGNISTLTLGTDYTISGTGLVRGGSVTLTNPLPDKWKISLERVLPAVQETDLRNQGRFYAETHEDAFDYLTMLIQQFGSLLDVSLRKPSWLSDYYDAKDNRISNLSDPKSQQDAVTLSYLINEIRKAVTASSVDMGSLSNTDSLALGDALIGVRQPFTGAIPRTQHDKNRDKVTFKDFGAIGDDTLHQLSERFTTLYEAKLEYPFVTSLSQSIDYAALQAAASSGIKWTSAPDDKLYRYVINESILINSHNTSFDLYGSEIRMVDPTGLKSHFIFKSDAEVQLQGNNLYNATLVNEYPSRVYQIKADFVSNFTTYNCTGYSPTYGKVWGFLELKRAIACFSFRCKTERMKDASVLIYGLAPDAHHSIDCVIYDFRFSDGDYGIKVVNYAEGMFLRRGFTYAQRTACIGFTPDSKATALGSIKIQEIDFDSPSLTGSFLFMRYVNNAQISGSWFSGPVNGPMIRLEETDSVLINSHQAYPTDAFILDNGVGTTLTSNMIVGGTVTMQFGPLADKTLVADNNIRNVVSAVDAAGHKKSLAVLSNKFDSSSSAITATTNPLHVIKGNAGDNTSGATTSSFIPSSPYETRVGPRPEAISLRKGATITSISVNDVEVYNSSDAPTASSFIGLGVLPPNTKIIVTFTGGSPWLNRVRT